MNNTPMLGIMVDCSRNAVMTVEALRHFIDCMEKMGYNMLMLYTEDTYEIPEEPRFGYLRGRYSQDELREIDAYAASHGVELIPCIQTLAHLDRLFRWQEYDAIRDTDDILLAEDERTELLIERMFGSLRACVKTDRIHIGMDEAHMLGLGKYLDKHGYCDRSEILLRHLKVVCRLAEKYGFRPMMWSDMFFRLAGSGYYGVMPDEAIDKVRPLIPDNLTLVYWDYYHTEKSEYLERIEGHRKLTDRVCFAGGIWTWAGFTPLDKQAFAVTDPAVRACRETGLSDVFFTAWGDDGGECSHFAALPEFYYAAELYRGNDDIDSIKEKFEKLFGIGFDTLLSLNDVNHVSCERGIDDNPSRYLFYNDPLLGQYDPAVPDGLDGEYAALRENYRTAAENAGYFKPHFLFCEALADVLSKKVCLGKTLRAAYQSCDKATLEKLRTAELPALRASLDEFLDAFRTMWYLEKKPHGFDIQHIRIGGLAARIDETEKRLGEYLDGRIDRIDELEETLLDADIGWWWSRTATVSVL